MTASKSSRARNARARAGAERSGTAAGRVNGSGSAARTGTATRTGTVTRTGTAAKAGTAVKAGAAARTGAGRADGQAQAPAGRTGAAPPGGTLAKGRDRLAAAMSVGQTPVPRWLRLTSFVLALAGLAVSVYLTITHFTQVAPAFCTGTGLVDCEKVTTSAQSYVFGVPVAVLGLVFYLFVVAIMSPWAWRSTLREVHLVRIAALIVGMGFVLYLLYAELFLIGSICLYCTSVHAITFILFVLTIFAAATWGLGPARSSR
jgi:uncharacterized membrane protein